MRRLSDNKMIDSSSLGARTHEPRRFSSFSLRGNDLAARKESYPGVGCVQTDSWIGVYSRSQRNRMKIRHYRVQSRFKAYLTPLGGMLMRRVFVSYSRKNLDAVTQLIKDLQDVGIQAWHDQTLTGGQRWWDNILANIRECDIFVFALSPESWDSEACRSELGYVVQLGKPILPVLVSDGININLLSAPLNEIQVTDYRRRDKQAAFALLKSINTTPPTEPLPDPLPTPPCVPVSYLSTLRDKIDSVEPLSPQDQITLLFELEEEFRDGRSPMETRDLLLRLKRRDDLLAKIASKIDALLKGAETRPPVTPPQVPGRGDYKLPAKVRLCPQCGTQAGPDADFCANCGTRISSTDQGPGPNAPTAAGAKCRQYACSPADAPQLIADVRGWLNEQGFDSQQLNTEDQSLLLQIKKRGDWRKYLGMATSLNIVFHQSGDTMTVEIGAGKWIDKAAVGTVSMFILWPLAVTAGYGVWEQMKMPENIFDYIGTRLICR